MIDGLLGKPERARLPPADLDDDECRRRTRVDRHEVELEAADMDVPGQNGPTRSHETDQDQRFGGVTCLLSSGPSRRDDRAIHAAMMATVALR